MTEAPRHYTDPLHWTPRTLADERAEAAAPMRSMARGLAGAMGADKESAPPPPANPAALVECRCGARKPAWALVDVRALSESVRGAQEFACPGCWSLWIREGRLTEAEWREHLGAPEALVESARAQPTLVSRDARRS